MSDPRIPEVETILGRIELQLSKKEASSPFMVGIHSGGAWIAEILHKRLGFQEPLGYLDISFYRDDFTRIGINPEVKASLLQVDIDDRNIILIDDVLHTWRTTRAAMNAIFDYGRPRSISLAVAIERNGRELPIQPDIVGAHVDLEKYEHIKLSGPTDLCFSISTKSHE